MKIPLFLRCDQCGCENYVFLDLDQSSFETECTCGHAASCFFGANVTAGYKILWRSNYELLQRKDYPLSIVFSATAFDCELTRLHFKWHRIRGVPSSVAATDEQLESLLRKYRTIDMKIEETAKLMDPRGFTGFVKDSAEFSEIVTKGYPSLDLDDLSKAFQRTLFWPRNRVLHLGDAGFSYEDARRTFNVATLGLRILNIMDERKGAK